MPFEQDDEQKRVTDRMQNAGLYAKALAAARIVWEKGYAALRCGLKRFYSVCYYIGAYTLRVFKRCGHRLAVFLKPAGQLLHKIADRLILRHVRTFVREIRRCGQGFRLAGQRLKAARDRHPLLVIPQALMLPVLAVRRHRKLVTSVLNLAAPVAAAFILAATVQHWSGLTYALELEVDGQSLGYISDESVYDQAAHMATERVINTDHSFEVQRIPKLTLTIAHKDDILDKNAVCDRILLSSSDSIAEVSGLYVDDRFVGAIQSKAALETMLQDILAAYKTDAEDEQAAFVQDIRIVDGLYPVSTIKSDEAMLRTLTSKTTEAQSYMVEEGDTLSAIARNYAMDVPALLMMNPDAGETLQIGQELLVQEARSFLTVKTVRRITYEEPIAFETVNQDDANRYVGYKKLKTSGKEGVRLIEAEVTLVDGVEQSREILSETVVVEPVNEVYVVGAKKYNANPEIGDGIATGKFIWPLPSCHMVSSPFGMRGRRHNGVDITGNGVENKPIIAADGGTVVEVNKSGYGGGYGLYVIIDHGGGYRTVYAHCNFIEVEVGQKVSQGQEIALAGNTGNSYGAHLHFEIRIDGVPTNPMDYVS